MKTYLVQSFARGEWETVSSHWSYRRAHRVLCRLMSREWSARWLRIVREDRYPLLAVARNGGAA